MGHEVYLTRCNDCKQPKITFNSKITNRCKCKEMKKPIKQMTKEDFELFYSLLSDKTLEKKFHKSQLEYWKKRVLGRIQYIKPVVDECEEKGIDLHTLSEGLHEEWTELNNCIDILNTIE